MRRHLVLVFALVLYLAGACVHAAFGQDEAGRIEVIEVKGIVDGSVERAVLGTIEEAERRDASLVVLQIDSRGVIDDARLMRLVDAISASRVPVAGWVGPPRARAENGAAVVALSAHLKAMAPGASIGPFETLDLRERTDTFAVTTTTRSDAFKRALELDARIGADQAEEDGLIDLTAPAVFDLLEKIDGRRVDVNSDTVRLSTDPATIAVRFHKPDLFGRVLHAAAQPSIAYLLLLLALVGIVFELFHPSTGPAGVSGLAALALALYGVVTLGASWVGVVLIVAGVAAFGVDLRYSSLGPFTVGGLVALVSGSLLLFRSPWLEVSPWVLALGVIGMVLFLLGAMTRVLRDLRAIARGELEVTDAHPHPNGQGGTDDT